MTSLAEQLRELKEEISDKKFTMVVLGSLPESYDFISSLNARNVELNWDNRKENKRSKTIVRIKMKHYIHEEISPEEEIFQEEEGIMVVGIVTEHIINNRTIT